MAKAIKKFDAALEVARPDGLTVSIGAWLGAAVAPAQLVDPFGFWRTGLYVLGLECKRRLEGQRGAPDWTLRPLVFRVALTLLQTGLQLPKTRGGLFDKVLRSILDDDHFVTATRASVGKDYRQPEDLFPHIKLAVDYAQEAQRTILHSARVLGLVRSMAS